jgi:hypothetical protein
MNPQSTNFEATVNSILDKSRLLPQEQLEYKMFARAARVIVFAGRSRAPELNDLAEKWLRRGCDVTILRRILNSMIRPPEAGKTAGPECHEPATVD